MPAPGAASLVLLAVLVACGVRPNPEASLRLVRRDGVEVTCAANSQRDLDAEAESVSAALPDLVHVLLQTSVPVRTKEARFAQAVQTGPALEYLSHLLCLEFGRDVLGQDAYSEWLTALEPRLRARVAARRNGSP